MSLRAARRRFEPYIRRCRSSDRSDDLRTAIRLAYFAEACKGKFYVMVQRGSSHCVVACGRNRAAIEESLLWLELRKRYGARFKHYARATRMRCLGVEMPEAWPPKRYDSGRYGKSLKGKGP